MMSIASIVEGDGEVAALPVLLRRLAAEWSPGAIVQALQPIRVRRDKFLNKDEEFRRQLLLAAAKSGEDGWVLIVLDTGPGVPDYALPRLGERFFTTARPNGERSGSGLGLAIVQRIAALHGGHLQLRNTHPGFCAALHLGPTAPPPA